MIDLPPELTTKLEIQLGLTFAKGPSKVGNLCFADNREVRSEFKEIFNSIDVMHYIAGVQHSQNNLHHQAAITLDDFPIPTNADQFWKMVTIGEGITKLPV